MKKITIVIQLIFLLSASMLIAGTYSGGDGSLGSPYQIANTDDLIELSNTPADWGENFIQTAHIIFDADETQVDWDGDGTPEHPGDDASGFSPIGSLLDSFTGEYDGQGFEIENLYIFRASTDNLGLFGQTSGAVIINIGIVNVFIQGNNWCGGLVGKNLSSSDINNSYSSGTVIGSNNIGGLAGENFSSTLSDSYSSCDVKGNYYVGALTGSNFISATIYNCYALGDVEGYFQTGGLVGRSYGGSEINNCYSRGDVNRIGGSDIDFGGFCGHNYNSNIEYCYSTGNVDCGALTDKGFLGDDDGTNTYTSNFFDSEASNQNTDLVGAATPKTTAEMTTQSTFTNAGWDFTSIWAISAYINDGYPYFGWQTFPTNTPPQTDLVLWLNAADVDADGNPDPDPPPLPAPDSFFDIWTDITLPKDNALPPLPEKKPKRKKNGIKNSAGIEFEPVYSTTGYGLSDILAIEYSPEITTPVEDRWNPDKTSKSYYMIIKTGQYVDPEGDTDMAYYSDGRQCIFEAGGPLSGINTYIANGKLCVGAWNRFEQKFTLLDPGGGYHNAETEEIYYVRYSYDGLDRKIETSIGKYDETGSTITTAGPISFQGITRDAGFPDDKSGVGGASRTRYHDYSTGETYSDHFGGLIGEILLYNGIPDENEVVAYFDGKFGTNFSSAAVLPKENSWIIIDKTEEIKEMLLSTAWPNPFATTCTFAVNMPESGIVKVELLNAAGQIVDAIYTGTLSKGMHEFTIDGSNLADGMYIYRMTGESTVKSGKVIFLR